MTDFYRQLKIYFDSNNMVNSRKFITLLKGSVVAVTLLSHSIAQQPSVRIENTSENKKVPQYQIEFENLSVVKRKEFVEHLVESKRLFSQKRIFEAFDVLAKADLILPNFPQVNNMMGASYVELRDFDSAFEYFKKAYKAEPNDIGVLFNMGEIFYIQGKWERAKSYFSKVYARSQANPSAISKLAKFKIAICDLKLGFKEKAEEVLSQYNYQEDTPIFYYLSAVVAFEEGNKAEANEFLKTARKVFKKDAIAPWQDSIIEAKYLDSFYGVKDTVE